MKGIKGACLMHLVIQRITCTDLFGSEDSLGFNREIPGQL